MSGSGVIEYRLLMSTKTIEATRIAGSRMSRRVSLRRSSEPPTMNSRTT